MDPRFGNRSPDDPTSLTPSPTGTYCTRPSASTSLAVASRASASKSDDTTKPYYNDLVAQQCWVDNGQAYVQNNTRGKDCPPHCPSGIPIPGATKCPNPLANLPELPKPHCRSLSASFGRVSLLGLPKANRFGAGFTDSWPLDWVPMANAKYPGNLSGNAMLVDFARITHSLPVDVNFVLYGKPACQPSETNTPEYFREVVKVCHQVNEAAAKKGAKFINCTLALNYSP